MDRIDFVHPWAFWGLLLLLLPTIAHLMRWQKPKTILFPDIRLIQKLWELKQRNRTPQRWLLLSMRYAALLSLVVFLAQPYYPSSLDGKETTVYLDASYSMSLPFDDKQSRWDAAKSALKEYLISLPADQRVRLYSESLPLNSDMRTADEWLDPLDSLSPVSGSSQLLLWVQPRMLVFTDGEGLDPAHKPLSHPVYFWPDGLKSMESKEPLIDSVGIEYHLSGKDSRGKLYARIHSPTTLSTPAVAALWVNRVRVAMATVQGKATKKEILSFEFALPSKAGYYPLQLTVGRDHWYAVVSVPEVKNSLFIGLSPPLLCMEQSFSTALESFRPSQWNEQKVHRAGFVMVEDADLLGSSQRKSLQAALNNGIPVVMGHSLSSLEVEKFDVLPVQDPFYKDMIQRLPEALLPVESSSLRDSLTSVRYRSLLQSQKGRTFLVKHRDKPLYHLAIPLNTIAWEKAGLDRTPYGRAWFRRMAYWREGTKEHSAMFQNKPADAFWTAQKWNKRHPVPAQGIRTDRWETGYWTILDENKDTVGALAVNPILSERFPSHPAGETVQKLFPNQTALSLEGEKQASNPFGWICGLVLVVALGMEAYLASKSVPLSS